MKGVRNPSAVVWSRIRNAESQAPAYAIDPLAMAEQAAQHSASVDAFIQTHGLDERVSKGIRELGPDLQRQLIAQDMGGVRNPSAVCWSRIRALNRGDVSNRQMAAYAPYGAGQLTGVKRPYGQMYMPAPALGQPQGFYGADGQLYPMPQVRDSHGTSDLPLLYCPPL